MSSARSIYPTLFEILKTVRPIGASGPRKNPVSAVDNVTMGEIPKCEGLLTLGPSQLVAIRIPVQHLADDRIKGYQKHLNPTRARDFARFLITTPNFLQVLPVVEVSIDGNGNAFYTDGQHRGAGAVIAGKSIRAVVTKRTEAEARKLFALQAKATKPSKNVLIFDGDDPYSEYIQDAVTDPQHPWHGWITTAHSGATKTRLSATSVFGMLRVYVARTGHIAGTPSQSEIERFDKDVADELAILVSAFGPKAGNPEAFTAMGLRAIAETARRVFRERQRHPDDIGRWIRHMSKFPFGNFHHLRSYTAIVDKMIEHWNKRCPEARKV